MNDQPYRKLYRSRKDRMIAGVWGGLAQYFRIDSTVFRVIAAMLLLLGGGIVACLFNSLDCHAIGASLAKA